VLVKPEQLLVPTDFTVDPGIPTRAFRDGEQTLENPGEPTRFETR
jgi:hypothetical protein